MILIEDHWLSNDIHNFIIVGFYTVNTPYQGESEVLKLSLKSLGYSYCLCGVKNLGSWQKNTQFKAEFIKFILEKLKCPILYLDVDSIVIKKLDVIDKLKCDIAAVHFHTSTELLSGTVYFGATAKCFETVEKWISLNKKYPEKLPDGRDAWDQRTLEIAIKETKCNFVELPQEYTWITELTQKHMPNLSPIIIHTRGAKRFKNQINGLNGYAT